MTRLSVEPTAELAQMIADTRRELAALDARLERIAVYLFRGGVT